MKRILTTAVLTALLGASVAFAGDNDCNVPENEWQPQETLEAKLKDEGWSVKKIKVDDGCYEVYGKTSDGKRVEAYFDPKTFEMVKSKEED